MPSSHRRAKESTTASSDSSPQKVNKRKLELSEAGAHTKRTSGRGGHLFEEINSEESDEEPRSAKRRSLHRGSRKETGNPVSKAQSSTQGTFAEMYTFKTKNAAQSQVHNLIDLTNSKSPTSSPLKNGLHLSNSFTPQHGPRKLVVKNIRSVAKEDGKVILERKWKDQEQALDTLFRNEDEKLLLEELYQGAEHICRQGQSQELYERVRQKCTTHLDTKLRSELHSKAQISSATEFAKAFVDTWMLWRKQLTTIRHIFFYLNQTYLVKTADDPDLDSMGYYLFRDIVFQDSEIQPAVVNSAVELIQLDRKGDSNSTTNKLARDLITAFHDLGVYTLRFEPAMSSASGGFFKSWRAEVAESSDLPHYVRSCSALIEKEMARCDDLDLDISTKSELSTLLDQILVEENVERMTNEDSLLDMLEGEMTSELEQTYHLLHRKEHEREIGPAFGKFIETEGSQIVFDEKKESAMVVRLLEFKRKLDNTERKCFHDNEFLGNTLHKSFEIFMNKTKKSQSNWDTDNAKPGEMIAKHVDLLLKGGPKAIPGLRKADKDGAEDENDFEGAAEDDTEVEQHLDDALDLFRFVHGKAVFEAFYKKDLARRLLMGRTQSFDAERSMLTRLRNECGAGFTHNLESMFKDMELAREEMKSYSQLLSDRGVRPNVDLAVNVLSVAAWPTYTDIPVNLPASILKAQSDFEQHYKTKHVGRKLTYKPALAHCQLKSKFPKGNKEIVVSGFQAVVLLLFNDVPADGSLSYEDIKTATGLPDNELIRTLQSLACAKYRVLTKNPKGREVNETDSFIFNANFSDPKMRIKINQIQLKETKEENKETHQRVAADRHYETQAAIVRIMKARKKIVHNELIVEVIKATRSRGVLDQADIKRNIEK